MNELNKLDNKKKIILITSIITLIILGIISATVAYFAWVGEESSISLTVVGEGSCTVKEDNNIFIEPTETRDGGRIIKFSAEQGLIDGARISWNMFVKNIGNLNHETFKYEMINTTTGNSYGSGNFADKKVGSYITFSNDTETLELDKPYEFVLYLWIDGTMGNNPLTMADQNFDFEMNCNIFDANIAPSGDVILIDFIKNEYRTGIRSLITQNESNDTYFYSYQDDSSTWGLMNDGLKVSNTLGDGSDVITDIGKLGNGEAGNIRYFGSSSKVKNYIYFNCSDYLNQSDSTCEKWRIIGIVDGKVKIIKEDSIGNLAWDQDKNIDVNLKTWSTNWAESSLQFFLNGLYYDRGEQESYTYFSGSSGTTETDIDLKLIGIKENTRELISNSVWYLGGYTSPEGLYPNDIYNYERKNLVGTTIKSGFPFTINTKIGLISASDFGFSTDLTKCTKSIYSYSGTDVVNGSKTYACRNNSWLFDSSNQWLITTRVTANVAPQWPWRITSAAAVYYNSSVYNAYAVRPSLYLNTSIKIDSIGDGSSSNPYRIVIE